MVLSGAFVGAGSGEDDISCPARKDSSRGKERGRKDMDIGIIGYGSMGRMLYEKMSGSMADRVSFYIANRTKENVEHLREVCNTVFADL